MILEKLQKKIQFTYILHLIPYFEYCYVVLYIHQFYQQHLPSFVIKFVSTCILIYNMVDQIILISYVLKSHPLHYSLYSLQSYFLYFV